MNFVIQQKLGGRWTDYDSDTDQHRALMTAKAVAKHGGHTRVVKRSTPASFDKAASDEYDRDAKRAQQEEWNDNVYGRRTYDGD